MTRCKPAPERPARFEFAAIFCEIGLPMSRNFTLSITVVWFCRPTSLRTCSRHPVAPSGAGPHRETHPRRRRTTDRCLVESRCAVWSAATKETSYAKGKEQKQKKHSGPGLEAAERSEGWAAHRNGCPAGTKHRNQVAV